MRINGNTLGAEICPVFLVIHMIIIDMCYTYYMRQKQTTNRLRNRISKKSRGKRFIIKLPIPVCNPTSDVLK